MVDASTLGFVTSLLMAVGAPLVYADQAWSIGKRRNSEGFSKDVCGVLLIANVARCFWWFHERFEFALLLQSILMITAQIGLLSLVLRYQPGSYASSAYTASYEDYLRSDLGSTSAPTPASNTPRTQRPDVRITVEPPTPATEQSNPLSPQSSTPRPQSNIAFDALFSTVSGDGGASRRGMNIPFLGNVTIPKLPVLQDSRGAYSSTTETAPSGMDDEEDEEDEDPVSLPTRLARRAKKVTKRTLHRLSPLMGIRNDGSTRADGSSASRPFGFWSWPTFSSYVAFLILYTLMLATLQIVFNSSSAYNSILSYFSLGLESSLPLPQFISNQQRKSLAGFRLSVLIGWFFGDASKTVYFIINASPLPFLLGGIFALSIDIAIVIQSRVFAEKTKEDEESERLVQQERENLAAATRNDGDANEERASDNRSEESLF
ncbi:unnamed protein product [Sympodiomycopsis kandeliae]